MAETYHDFETFYTDDFIKSIANNPKWTVSDINKVPIDMFSYEYRHQIHGALFTDERSLITLPHLCELIPNAANNAYFLDAIADGFVVLDIEPKCPALIKKQLLKLPYVYGEKSMSGKGYHLIFPLPKCMSDYPIAQTKLVMKEEHGYYEILLNHWVTFTRNQIALSTHKTQFSALFKQMAAAQKETIRQDVNIDGIKPDNIHRYDQIISMLLDQTYTKTADDFYGDLSKYEYATIGFFYWKLKKMMEVIKNQDTHVYRDNEQAWILYVIAQEKIPHRDKHDTARNGLPWLLYLTQEILAKNQ